MANSLTISGELAYAKAQSLMPAFDAAAAATGVDRNLLLAVASRESRMGLALDYRGLGDGGHGHGLMQVDNRYHSAFTATHSPSDHRANVLKGAQILKAELNRYGQNKTYALPAYNAGSGNVDKAVRQGLLPDYYTTGRDYGQDVLDRYNIIRSMGETKTEYQGGKLVTVKEKPEDEAQRLVIYSGVGLLGSLLATSYIAAKAIKN